MYYAKISKDSIVEQVIKLAKGKDQNWLEERLGGTWVVAAEKKLLDKRFPGVGDYYDEQNGTFTPPKPFDSWILNENLNEWEAPIPYPDNSKKYYWNESIVNWELVETEEE